MFVEIEKKTYRLWVLPLCVVCMFLYSNHAAAFNVEDGFDVSLDGAVTSVTTQADGKVLIGGEFLNAEGEARFRIARLHADGTLDTTFNPTVDAAVKVVVVQGDGKILIGGDFTLVNSFSRAFVARLNIDGSLDTGFDPGAGANASVSAIGIQSNGKIVVGGAFTSIDGVSLNYVARLDTDGSVDTSFMSGSGADNSVDALTVQIDNKIVIGGTFTNFDGVNRNHVARLDANGGLDPGFDPGTGTDGPVLSLASQVDSKIIVAGQFNSFNGTSRANVLRLESSGSLDAGFATGVGANGAVKSVSIQPDGKVLIGGDFTSVNGTSLNRIARLNTDGDTDADFAPGTGANNSVRVVSVRGDAEILMGGDFVTVDGESRTYLARLNPDGGVDQTFDTGTGVDGFVYAQAIQPDGKIVIGGGFQSINGINRLRIARLNADGSVDTGFDPGTGSNGTVFAIAIQPDGKIVIGGVFTTINGVSRVRIARLNADGSLDTGFDPGMGAGGTVQSVVLQPDGKILVGGTFTLYDNISRSRLARVNTDGSLDTTFNPGTGADGIVFALNLQPDGKVLVGGAFTSINGTTRNRIARLNADGSLDSSFDPGTGADGTLEAIAVQADGKVIVAGEFTTMNNNTRNNLARLNTDGAVDVTFNTATSIDSRVVAVAIQPNGKIVIGGNFQNVSGMARDNIARLNTDASLDTAFDPGAGANGFVRTIAAQPDGKIIIGGFFTFVDGESRKFIARIRIPESAIQSLLPAQDGQSVTWSRSGVGPVLTWVSLETSTDQLNWTPIGNAQRITGGWRFSNIGLPFESLVYLRARGYHAISEYGSGSIVESIRQIYLPEFVDVEDECTWFVIKTTNGVVTFCL